MNYVRPASLVLLAALIFLAGCASTGRRGDSRTSRQAVQNQSGTLRIPYEVPRKASRLSLALTIHASGGSFIYTLVDPQNAPVWQGWVNTGQNVSETRDLKPRAGEWVLTLVMQGASGSYNAVWTSK